MPDQRPPSTGQSPPVRTGHGVPGASRTKCHPPLPCVQHPRPANSGVSGSTAMVYRPLHPATAPGREDRPRGERSEPLLVDMHPRCPRWRTQHGVAPRGLIRTAVTSPASASTAERDQTVHGITNRSFAARARCDAGRTGVARSGARSGCDHAILRGDAPGTQPTDSRD